MSKLKESFYQNHSGGSVLEINLITATILTGHLLYLTLIKCGLIRSRLDKFSWGFVCYVFNILLATTAYSNHHRSLLFMYCTPTVGLRVVAHLFPDVLKSRAPAENQELKSRHEDTTKLGKQQRVGFLSVYRATMMITTIISILAVDLPIFPRRFAKSETWGTSLMDLGVGSFVFSSGIVSSMQGSTVLQSMRQGAIILVMGVGRALMVRGTGYHEHVSEYGVHWNFFITLALLPPLLPIFRKLQSVGVPFILQGIGVTVLYQTLLLQTKWQAWIIGAYRDNLLAANKEGISSFVGYVAIYLLGLDSGCMILARKPRPILLLLFCSGMAYAAGYMFVTRYMHIRVSRRIANSPYILWVAAHNTLFALSLALLERLATGSGFSEAKNEEELKTPYLLGKINLHGIFVFLGANLLTGAINLVMGDHMMITGPIVGLAIMILYGLIVTVSSMLL